MCEMLGCLTAFPVYRHARHFLDIEFRRHSGIEMLRPHFLGVVDGMTRGTPSRVTHRPLLSMIHSDARREIRARGPLRFL